MSTYGRGINSNVPSSIPSGYDTPFVKSNTGSALFTDRAGESDTFLTALNNAYPDAEAYNRTPQSTRVSFFSPSQLPEKPTHLKGGKTAYLPDREYAKQLSQEAEILSGEERIKFIALVKEKYKDSFYHPRPSYTLPKPQEDQLTKLEHKASDELNDITKYDAFRKALPDYAILDDQATIIGNHKDATSRIENGKEQGVDSEFSDPTAPYLYIDCHDTRDAAHLLKDAATLNKDLTGTPKGFLSHSLNQSIVEWDHKDSYEEYRTLQEDGQKSEIQQEGVQFTKIDEDKKKLNSLLDTSNPNSDISKVNDDFQKSSNAEAQQKKDEYIVNSLKAADDKYNNAPKESQQEQDEKQFEHDIGTWSRGNYTNFPDAKNKLEQYVQSQNHNIDFNTLNKDFDNFEKDESQYNSDNKAYNILKTDEDNYNQADPNSTPKEQAKTVLLRDAQNIDPHYADKAPDQLQGATNLKSKLDGNVSTDQTNIRNNENALGAAIGEAQNSGREADKLHKDQLNYYQHLKSISNPNNSNNDNQPNDKGGSGKTINNSYDDDNNTTNNNYYNDGDDDKGALNNLSNEVHKQNKEISDLEKHEKHSHEDERSGSGHHHVHAHHHHVKSGITSQEKEDFASLKHQINSDGAKLRGHEYQHPKDGQSGKDHVPYDVVNHEVGHQTQPYTAEHIGGKASSLEGKLETDIAHNDGRDFTHHYNELHDLEYNDYHDDSHGGVHQEANSLCFLTGTMIKTVSGEKVVEDLSVGDVAITASGERKPIAWIGHQDVIFSHKDEKPVCVKANAIADGVPYKDLYTSAAHAYAFTATARGGGYLVGPRRMCLSGLQLW